MKNLYKLCIFVLVGVTNSTYAQEMPLDKTTLFTKTLHDCKELNLKSWNHPTKQILLSNKVKIERVLLCNAGKYPVFFVDLPYDPQGQTASYFNPLYAKMRKANGGWSYSFVATSDNTIVNVSYTQGIANVDYEMYAP